MGRKYSTLWSDDFTDDVFLKGLREWLTKGQVRHKTPHVKPYAKVAKPTGPTKIGTAVREGTAGKASHHGRFRRRLHGHVQRHDPR